MPTVNIYVRADSEKKTAPIPDSLIEELRATIAQALSCGARNLQPGEISVRCLDVHGGGMIAPIEVEITAYAYEERVPRSDSVCLSIRKFLMDKLAGPEDVRVWTNLTELGHSWED